MSPPAPSQAGFLPEKANDFIAFGAGELPCAMFCARNLRWISPLAVLFGGAIILIQPRDVCSAKGMDFLTDCFGLAAGTIIGPGARLYFAHAELSHMTHAQDASD